MQQHPHIGFFIPLQRNSPVYDSNLVEQPAPVPPVGINLGNRKLDVQANGDKPSTAVRHVAENSFTHLGQYAISGIRKPVDHHLAQAAGKSLDQYDMVAKANSLKDIPMKVVILSH